jgi:phosphomannomutase
VRDKDGISAAVILAELAATRRSEKKTLLDELETISRRHGLYVSGQRAITLRGADGLAQIGRIMKGLRDAAPEKVGPLAVLAVSDLEAQSRRTREGATERLPLPPSNVLVYELEGGSRVIARPSGTEPKIKYYFDVRETIAGGEAIAAATARAMARVDELAAAFTALTGVS